MQNKKIDKQIKNNEDKYRGITDRLEKLEISMILLINQLRDSKELPNSLLETIEKILLSREN